MGEQQKTSFKVLTLENVGVRVKFPFTPYTQQEKMISNIIQTVQEKKNCLIDSPTGTGKTLCMLTSLLAWIDVYKEWRREQLNPNSKRDEKVLRELHKVVFGEQEEYCSRSKI
jgi:Rad3-related DNA helicase